MTSFLATRTVFFGRGEEVMIEDQQDAMPPPLPMDESNPTLQQEDVNFGDDAVVDLPVNGEEPLGTVVSLAEARDEDEDEDDDDDDNADIVNNLAPETPVADLNIKDASPTPAATGKKRGRPSLSASISRNGTPAKMPSAVNGKKTPRTVNSASGAKVTATPTGAKRGRKRKAHDSGEPARPAPAKKARVARTIRPEREPTRALSKRKAADAAKTTFATALKPKITAVPVATNDSKRSRKAKAPAAKESGQAWEVEEIIDSAIDADTKAHMYLVKWKGYSAEDNTWEPRKNLSGCAALLKAFNAQKKKSAKKATAPKETVTPRKAATPRKTTTIKKASAPKPAAEKRTPGRRGRKPRAAKT